jgi:hypothetical protein
LRAARSTRKLASTATDLSKNWVQRSLIFIYVGLEQGPISFIYRAYAPRASRDQIDAFIAKGGLLIVCYRSWMNCRWGAIYAKRVL